VIKGKTPFIAFFGSVQISVFLNNFLKRNTGDLVGRFKGTSRLNINQVLK
jgi:hypothetical protein